MSATKSPSIPDQDLSALSVSARIFHAMDESLQGVMHGGQEQVDLFFKYLDQTMDRSTDLGHDGIDAVLEGGSGLANWFRGNIEALAATGFQAGDAVEQLTEFVGDFACNRWEDGADSFKAFSRADSIADFVKRQQRSAIRNLANLREDGDRLLNLLPDLGSQILYPLTDRIGVTLDGLQIDAAMNDPDRRIAA